MIPRYTPEDVGALWSPLARYRTWLDVELAACEAMETAGLVPVGTASPPALVALGLPAR